MGTSLARAVFTFAYRCAYGLDLSGGSPVAEPGTHSLVDDGTNAMTEVGSELLGLPCAKKKFPLLRFRGAWKRQETIQN